jgi:hypothetical protein
MYFSGASTPEFFQLRLVFVTSTSCGRAEAANSLHCAAGYNWVVMLSGAKHLCCYYRAAWTMI